MHVYNDMDAFQNQEEALTTTSSSKEFRKSSGSQLFQWGERKCIFQFLKLHTFIVSSFFPAECCFEITESPHAGLVVRFGVCAQSWAVPQKQKYLLFSILEEGGDTACMCVRSVMTPTPHTKPVASSSAYGSEEGVGGGRDVGDFTSSHGVR